MSKIAEGLKEAVEFAPLAAILHQYLIDIREDCKVHGATWSKTEIEVTLNGKTHRIGREGGAIDGI